VGYAVRAAVGYGVFTTEITENTEDDEALT
jgi:hypothetical protein